MKKILIFIACYTMCIAPVFASSRDGNTTTRAATGGIRQGATSSMRLVSTRNSDKTTSRKTTLGKTPVQSTPSRATRTVSRVTQSQAPRTTPSNATIIPRATQTVTARATDNASIISETRTGAEYEKCKSAYFSCMDQFCQLKNDNYRRCSCNDRVFQLDSAFDELADAGEQLNTFTSNLDVVGMTAAQATAMRNASEGENALTGDNSSSKALLQAIMNSIRGSDTTVGGRYSDLNSINLAFDTANAFGNADAGQVIASYNGQALYSAVYPSCRRAVANDCNDASLQRAITAYLMAIEQDCNTVQTAITNKQKDFKSALREGSAMLDLARVENRKKHNSSDFTTCINDVESAILSEEVCGANYHKCLDNGEFIDITTGKPIAGVERFYELGQMLTFPTGIEAANQKLSKILNNRQFVQNFESHTKKFAADALDKCTENADDVWAEYLDRALLAIYYAQQAKVSEIKQTCFDYISSCYTNMETGLSAATAKLKGDNSVVLQPDLITLNTQMCQNYINSCNNMFGEQDIIREYVETRKNTDVQTACRAIAKQCFTKYGGTNFQNFYYLNSGTIQAGHAIDWFTLYDYSADRNNPTLKSECAKQLAGIESCNTPEILETVFGGFDSYHAKEDTVKDNNDPNKILNKTYQITTNTNDNIYYGLADKNSQFLDHRYSRSAGVATEVYNQIIDILSTQCMNAQGRFMEYNNIPYYYNITDTDNPKHDETNCVINTNATFTPWGVGVGENMCPRDYAITFDTKSWGACLCWENGARRSKNGQSVKCVAAIPKTAANDAYCKITVTDVVSETTETTKTTDWCLADNTKEVPDTPTNPATTKLVGAHDANNTVLINPFTNQVCRPNGFIKDKKCYYKKDDNGTQVDTAESSIPEGIIK